MLHKILIRSTNWLGDALLTTPAIHSIKNHYPEAELTVLARPGVAPVFEANPDIRRVMVYENQGRHRGLRGKWLLAGALKQEGFEAAVHFPHSFESAWISFLSGIPVRVGYATEGRGPTFDQARALPAEFQGAAPGAFLPGTAGRPGDPGKPEPGKPSPAVNRGGEHWQGKADRRLAALGVDSGESLIGLAPGAQYGWAKCWPFSDYHQLAERIRREGGAKVVLLGTSRDALAGIAGGRRRSPRGRISI